MCRCAVPFCKSFNRNKNTKTEGVSFHEFPSDYILREKWIRAIARKDPCSRGFWTPSCRSVVCSLHFTADCFKTTTKLRVLLPDSVPTIFPGYPSYMQPCASKKRRPLKKNCTNSSNQINNPTNSSNQINNPTNSSNQINNPTNSSSQINDPTNSSSQINDPTNSTKDSNKDTLFSSETNDHTTEAIEVDNTTICSAATKETLQFTQNKQNLKLLANVASSNLNYKSQISAFSSLEEKYNNLKRKYQSTQKSERRLKCSINKLKEKNKKLKQINQILEKELNFYEK